MRKWTASTAPSEWSNGSGKGLNSGSAEIKIPQGAIIKDGKIDFQGLRPEVVGGRRQLDKPQRHLALPGRRLYLLSEYFAQMDSMDSAKIASATTCLALLVFMETLVQTP
jgi:hypothetical protein